MSDKNVTLAVSYYQAMGNKDLLSLEKHLHPDVQLIGPMATVKGKAAVLNSVKHFLDVFNKLTVRAQCSREDQVMLAYDLNCPGMDKLVRGAVLLNFHEGLIIRYELFYDASPFLSKKDEIFAQS